MDVLQNAAFFLIAVCIDDDDRERAKEMILLFFVADIDCANAGCITDASAALIKRHLCGAAQREEGVMLLIVLLIMMA
jgi:hypothetical protein